MRWKIENAIVSVVFTALVCLLAAMLYFLWTDELQKIPIYAKIIFTVVIGGPMYLAADSTIDAVREVMK